MIRQLVPSHYIWINKTTLLLRLMRIVQAMFHNKQTKKMYFSPFVGCTFPVCLEDLKVSHSTTDFNIIKFNMSY